MTIWRLVPKSATLDHHERPLFLFKIFGHKWQYKYNSRMRDVWVGSWSPNMDTKHLRLKRRKTVTIKPITESTTTIAVILKFTSVRHFSRSAESRQRCKIHSRWQRVPDVQQKSFPVCRCSNALDSKYMRIYRPPKYELMRHQQGSYSTDFWYRNTMLSVAQLAVSIYQ